MHRLFQVFLTGLGVRVFANGLGDLGSIPGRVIPKTQKMVLDASLLNTQHYKVRIKGKVEQSREGVAPSPTHCCSSYRKGSLRVTLDYGRQLYLFANIYMILSIPFKYWSSLNRSIWPINGSLIGTTTSALRRPRVNSTLPEFQNWNLTTRCSLVSYPGYQFFRGSSQFLRGTANMQ